MGKRASRLQIASLHPGLIWLSMIGDLQTRFAVAGLNRCWLAGGESVPGPCPSSAAAVVLQGNK